MVLLHIDGAFVSTLHFIDFTTAKLKLQSNQGVHRHNFPGPWTDDVHGDVQHLSGGHAHEPKQDKEKEAYRCEGAIFDTESRHQIPKAGSRRTSSAKVTRTVPRMIARVMPVATSSLVRFGDIPTMVKTEAKRKA